jgi:hypothetical protein
MLLSDLAAMDTLVFNDAEIAVSFAIFFSNLFAQKHHHHFAHTTKSAQGPRSALQSFLEKSPQQTSEITGSPLR